MDQWVCVVEQTIDKYPLYSECFVIMHYFYSYLHFFSAMLFLILGIIIIIRNFGSRLNQACAGVMFCFFIWSLSTTWVQHPVTTEKTARFVGAIATIGWMYFPTFHLLFAWLYTKQKPFRFIRVVTLLFFLLPAVLVGLQWKYSLFISTFSLRSYGWFTPWTDNGWSTFYFVYLAIMTITAFWLIFDYGRKSDNTFIRRQSLVIIVTGTLSLISGFLFNVFFSLFIPEGFPAIGDVTSLAWASGLTYVALRYNMLNITPFIAANKIIDTMKDLLFLLDTHGYIITVNSAAQRVLGCQMHQITARYFGELITGTNEQRTEITNAMLKQEEYSAEAVISCLGGPSIPVALSTSLIPGTGVVCLAHDITLQKQRTESLKDAKRQLESRVMQATEDLRQINTRLLTEIEEKNGAVAALKESEERFRIIFEHAPDGIVLLDHIGNFIDGNNEALRIIGCKKHDASGKNLFSTGLLPDKYLQGNENAQARIPNTPATGYHELSLKISDTKEIPVEISTHQLTISEKKMNICIIRDLSQRKKAEKEAEELRSALHHSQKMDAVGRLAGGIAHDFNNLLGGIIGYAGILKKRLPPEFPDESEILGKMIDVSKQAADRTAQLLAFARKGKYNIQTINIHTIISDVINLMKHTIDPKITITSRLNAGFSMVQGDKSQLHSAFLNLGVNARDALPDGGVIEFSTEIIPGADVLSSDVTTGDRAEHYLKITVKDNGVGMDEETKSRVFEPFFSTKPEGKGTGLGLPSVYGTVKQHGGYISLESALDKGTTFILYLPVAGDAPVPAEKCTACAQQSSIKTGTILVVDDTPLIREMMVEALESEGYTVHSCENGNDGLAWFRSNYVTCDLVILDYAMPGMNGKECFLEMLKVFPSIKAIIASGYALDGEIEQMLKAGACSFMHKPFELEDLTAKVREVLAGTGG